MFKFIFVFITYLCWALKYRYMDHSVQLDKEFDFDFC